MTLVGEVGVGGCRVPATTCEQPVAAAAAESGCPPLQPAAHEVVRPGRSTAESRERGGQEETLGDSREKYGCFYVMCYCEITMYCMFSPSTGRTSSW